MQPEVAGKAFLLQRQAANGAACHLGRDAKVAEHMTHESLVILEGFITGSAHLKIMKKGILSILENELSRYAFLMKQPTPASHHTEHKYLPEGKLVN